MPPQFVAANWHAKCLSLRVVILNNSKPVTKLNSECSHVQMY
jgi:hypothetical protein